MIRSSHVSSRPALQPRLRRTANTHLPVVEEDVAVLLLHLELDLRPVAALQGAQHHQEVAEEDGREHSLVERHLPDDDAGAAAADVAVQRSVPQAQTGALRRPDPGHAVTAHTGTRRTRRHRRQSPDTPSQDTDTLLRTHRHRTQTHSDTPSQVTDTSRTHRHSTQSPDTPLQDTDTSRTHRHRTQSPDTPLQDTDTSRTHRHRTQANPLRTHRITGYRVKTHS